ncbi:hypothetical protein AK812_SmicGene173 [Symbiodinium microadriaticum]|uniref:PPM-type phosphatase domain-containing protein n=1 Tax=Symbiodinium microadriaticum TaxID=2951 RepID=A0A1Q9F753_SYMMI|nr:hypothetical protein AK812_SmicGene173 [Symbiodinium microadriaticum]
MRSGCARREETSWRTSMEVSGEGGKVRYAVFDGHGGKVGSASQIWDLATGALGFALSVARQSSDILTALKGVFHRMDDMLRMPEYFDAPWLVALNHPRQVVDVLRNSIKDDMADARAKGCITKEASAMSWVVRKMMLLRRMGAEEATEPAFSVGCAAVCVLVTPCRAQKKGQNIGGLKRNDIICANAGDSRAVSEEAWAFCEVVLAAVVPEELAGMMPVGTYIGPVIHPSICLASWQSGFVSQRWRIEAAGGTVAAMRRGQITTYRVNGPAC